MDAGEEEKRKKEEEEEKKKQLELLKKKEEERRRKQLRKIGEFDRLLKEAPKFSFSVNVFAHNVKLGGSEEEVKGKHTELIQQRVKMRCENSQIS